MSTTTDPEVALTYAGKGPGLIFIIDFGMASRGASLQFLSQCAAHRLGPLHSNPPRHRSIATLHNTAPQQLSTATLHGTAPWDPF